MLSSLHKKSCKLKKFVQAIVFCIKNSETVPFYFSQKSNIYKKKYWEMIA